MWKILCGALVVAGLHTSAAYAQDNFYEGKQIELVVGFNPGGTYDLYSRVAAEWLPRFIPGNPAIIVQNMPGAAGALAANFLHTQASQDGLTVGMISQAAALQQVIDRQGVSYDVRDFNWIGRFAPVVEVTAVWNTSPVKTIEDAIATKTVIGGTSAGGTSHMMPTIMNKIVGTQFDIILGYQGTNGAEYAMEMGEVEGAHSTVENLLTQKAEWLENDTVSLLVQYARERHPSLPDVPAMTEFGTTDEDKQILGLFASSADIGRSLVAPPNVPEAQLTVLRDAFTAMVNDPEFQAVLEERNLELGALSGADLQARINETMDLPSGVTDRVVELLSDVNE
jgi:tripartite-type tricarboxylate transporter receptor subunit TctC